MKPKILTFVRHYAPGYKSGGPQTSVMNLTSSLSDAFDFWVITLDNDLGESEAFETITHGEWNTVNGHRVYYLSKSERRLGGIKKLIQSTEHDVLYLNGIFSAETTIFPLLARRFTNASSAPCVLAPRGSFSLGALALKSPKKRAFLAVASVLGLLKDVIWQASTEMEAEDIKRVQAPSKERISIAQDLPVKVDKVLAERPERSGALKVVFLSRVSPMKNLEFALEVLAQCKQDVEFDIYGPIEDQTYWEKCQTLISRLPKNVIANYQRSLKPAEVAGVFRSSDLMFLPSRGENYGHVVFEALATGTPVLVSDKTPWRGFPANVGAVLPLDDQAAFARHIDQIAQLAPVDFAKLVNQTHAHALHLERTNEDVDRNAQMFHDALAKRLPSTKRV